MPLAHALVARRASAPRGASARPRAAHAAHPVPAPRCPCTGGCPRCAPAPRASGPGRPLDPGLRRRAESALGAGPAALAGVRVHTDPAAAEVARAHRARAVAAGRDIYFAPGQYAPHTRDGERRIAHELSHVVQQARGRPAGGVTPARRGAAEREARRAGDAVAAGGRAEVAERTAGAVQRDGPDDAPDYHLHLDPEVQAILARHWLWWWVGSALTTGDPETPPAAPDEAAPAAGEAAVPAPEEYTPTPSVPDPSQLPAEFFAPIAPDVLDPDVGALMAPYGTRGVPLGTRDVDAALAVYRSNYRFVSLLPDLRSVAPGFLRPLIPGDWRRSMAGAFTSATIDAQIRHDFPTPIEAADRMFESITGVSTTYIPIPGISF